MRASTIVRLAPSLRTTTIHTPYDSTSKVVFSNRNVTLLNLEGTSDRKVYRGIGRTETTSRSFFHMVTAANEEASGFHFVSNADSCFNVDNHLSGKF